MYAHINRKKVEQVLRLGAGRHVTVKAIQTVGGGSINYTCKVSTTAGHYFLKVNEAPFGHQMFDVEQKGLNILHTKSDFTIPAPLGVYDIDNTAFLLMEFIDASTPLSGYWQLLAINLAKLHRHSSEYFGLNHDNFIGSLPQDNTPEKDWPQFFSAHRLQPLVKLAFDNGLIELATEQSFEALLHSLNGLMPAEPPALLHGDLWSGNLLVDGGGNPCLVDPAVYYGHREMDLAFSRMFGGFSQEFYVEYEHVFPLEQGFEARLDLYNLYPLLVHLNLFGKSYLGQIKSILKRFT